MRFAKLIAAILAGLGILSNSLIDGKVTASEWVNVAIAALGALGVGAIANSERPATPDDD